MELHVLDTAKPRWPSSSFLSPTTRLTKVLKDQPKFFIIAAKRNSENTSQGVQNLSKRDLSRILITDAAIKNIENKANSDKYKHLWPKAVLESLDDAIKQNKWESALKIFSLLRKQRWYEPKCRTYTKLLVMLGKCRQPKQATLLFEIMRMDGLRPTIDVYTALVSAYGMSGLLDKAFHTVDDMKSVSDCKPDVYTYSILIKCCTKSHRFDMIGHILAEMSYLGIECSTVTYNTLIDGYGKAKLFELMESSLSDMIESGTCLPDIFTFNSVLGAYGTCGKIEKMEKWYDEFQLMRITPDVMTFNILIRSYGKAGMYDKMESVMEFMRKRLYSPTIVTFNIVIDTFGRAQNIEKVDEFFLKMKHQGMKPNSITYCSLVNAYSKAGCLRKADSILRQIANSDVILDTPFFNCVISAYGLAGDVEKMDEIFLAMKERDCKPDNITYSTMLQAYNAKGMIEVAKDFESKMIAGVSNSETMMIGC